MYWHVIPKIRADVVFNLKQKGMYQKDIAELLGVSIACISQILKRKRSNNKKDIFTEEQLEKLKLLSEEIHLDKCEPNEIDVQILQKAISFLCGFYLVVKDEEGG